MNSTSTPIPPPDIDPSAGPSANPGTTTGKAVARGKTTGKTTDKTTGKTTDKTTDKTTGKATAAKAGAKAKAVSGAAAAAKKKVRARRADTSKVTGAIATALAAETLARCEPMPMLTLAAVPAYLHAELARAAKVIRPSEIGDGYVYEPDFARLFRGAKSGGRTPASAAMLYSAAEGLIGAIVILTDGRDAWGPQLQLATTACFDVAGLTCLLPDPVVDWLVGFTADEAAAWVAFLMTEIQMHALQLAAGRWPSPHSTGSEMALHLILRSATWLAMDDDGEPSHHAALPGYASRVDALDDLYEELFEDDDVTWLERPELAEFAMGCTILHPANWFVPFRDGINPWVAPVG